MNDWIKRSVWGLVFVAVVISATYYNFWTLLGLSVLVSTVCLYEYLKMLKLDNFINLVFVFLVNLMLIGMCEYEYLLTAYGSVKLLISQYLLVTIVFVIYQLVKYKTEFLAPTAKIIFANIYISIPFLLFLNLQPLNSELVYDWRYPMLVFFLVWSSDTFAYVAGRLLGKRPLFVELSPKKTLEGFAGGAILSTVVGILLAYLWNDFLTYTDGIILAILVSVTGTFGDLAESALKRNAEVKDSGKILPGHGGALDRFDAFIFAAVVVFIYFSVVGKI